ncbi:MAG: outer membrane channel protein TolC [Aeromonadaceae bacterium]|nr:outer membrane channel protein TolC [Aeromonadaceae bacterium]
MKKSLLSMMVLLGTSGLAHADNLLDIYHLAQQKDPQLLEAKAVRDKAFEAINEAEAAQLPQINLGANLGYQKTNRSDYGTAGSAGANLGLSQSLYRRSNWINSDISAKAATQADVAYNAEQQNLMVRSAQAYFAVLSAQDTLEFAKANLQALQRQLDETQQRYEVGMTAITDVHEAKAAADLAEANVIQAENALSNSYEGLRQLTGAEHKFLDILNTERFATSPLELDADSWMKLAEDSNLSLHSQRIAKEIAKQQIELAQTGHEPTLDLSASLSSAYTDYKNSGPSYNDGTLNTGAVGLQFNLPLYQGGAVDSRVKQAQYSYVAASEALERTFRDVQTTLNRNYNDVNGSIGTVRAYQQSVISAESALTATRAGYEVGTRTVVDLLDATRNLYSAKQQLSTARYNYILNRLAIKQTAGTLSEEDLLGVNQGLKPAS